MVMVDMDDTVDTDAMEATVNMAITRAMVAMEVMEIIKIATTAT